MKYLLELRIFFNFIFGGFFQILIKFEYELKILFAQFTHKQKLYKKNRRKLLKMSPSPKFTTSQVSNKVPAIAKWFGIIGLLFFSISSNISNDTMSSIPYELSDYFGIKVGMINATYVSAKFLNFLVAPLAIFIIDYLGPTVTIYASLISSIIVILFRVISFSVGGLAGILQ